MTEMRKFGEATRDSLEGKLEYSGFLSPGVLKTYCEYMDKHRKQKDGSIRGSDNWKSGMPQHVYLDSLLRHVMDVWMNQQNDGIPNETMTDALCGVLFNAMGMLYELNKIKGQSDAQSEQLKREYESPYPLQAGEHVSLGNWEKVFGQTLPTFKPGDPF